MANVNINLNQYLNNAYVGTNSTDLKSLQDTGTAKLADAAALLKNIATGDVVKGTILDMTGNQVTVGLGENSIHAMLSGDVAVNIGDLVSFEVNKTNPEQIILKALDSDSAKNPEVKFAGNALEQANLPITEKNTAIVMELVKNNMSVDKDSLQKMSGLTREFPDVSVKTLVDLTKMQVPVTRDNITQYENYKNFEHSISDKLPVVTNELQAMLKDSEGIAVFKDVINTFSEEGGEGLKASEALGKEELQALADLTKDPSLKQEILKGDMKLSDMVSKLVSENASTPEKLAEHEVIKKAVKELVDNKFLLKPEDIAKDGGIKDFYSKVLKETAHMSETLSKFGKESSPMNEQLKDIRQNVSFMNDLNHAMAYVQLPLKFANQNVHSDLFVFKDKRRPIDKNNISALLHLDMDNLGSMDIYVKLANQKDLTTNFMLENEEMLDFIMEHIDILDAKLKKLGYNTNISVTESKKKSGNAVIEEIIPEKTEDKSMEIMRFRVDLKA